MADRQLKIVVRTEIKKGFADLNKQMQQLSASMRQLGALSTSIDKLARSFDGVAKGAKQAATATKQANNEAISLVKKNRTEQEKLIDSVGKLRAAEKSKAISNAASLRTQIKLVSDYIKKTQDATLLEKRRDSKGRFGYSGIDPKAVTAIKGLMDAERKLNNELAKPITKRITLVTENRGQGKAIANQMAFMTRGDSSNTNFYRELEKQQQAAANAAEKEATRAARANRGGSTGRGSGGSGYRIARLPNSGDVNVANKLMQSYTKLGHVLFQLQYSTYTLFGVTGIGYIAKQADAYINLRNEIARTSNSIEDVGGNMKDVFDISKKTFTSAADIGKLYSTINKYSEALKFSSKDVASVTQTIAAAFAASPGSADAKSAAQYQFIQGFQSGRFGGDELRSVLEQAPYVGEIMSRGLAKQRGLPAGSMVDLRAQKGKISPTDIANTFKDPEVQAQVMKVLAERTRTFGDVMAVARTRMIELAGKVEEGSGMFGQLWMKITEILTDDTRFNNFVKAIESATVGLAALGAVAGSRAAMSALGGAKGLFTKSGLTGKAAFMEDAMFAAANRENGRRNLVSSVSSMASGARSNALGAATSFAIAPLATAGNMFKSLGSILMTVVKVGGTLFARLGGISAIIFAVAARFNHLLGIFGGGITIFDIIGGLWDKITRGMQGFFNFVAPFTDWLIGLVDGPLKAIINWAKDDKDIKGRKDKRLAVAEAARKNLLTGQKSNFPSGGGDDDKAAKGRRDPVLEFMRDLALSVTQARQNSLIPEQMTDIAGIRTDTIKKASDALDIDGFNPKTGTFASDDQLIELIKSSKNKQKDKVLELMNKAIKDLTDIKLGEKMKEFVKTLGDQVNSILLNTTQRGMTNRQSSKFSAESGLIESIITNPNFVGNMSDERKAQIREGVARGEGSKILSSFGRYDSTDVTSMDNQNKISEAVGNLINALDRDTEWTKSATNGMKAAAATYYEAITNAADNWGNVVTTALQGLENYLVSALTTKNEDFNSTETLKAVGLDITKAIATAFVRQKLIAPIMEKFGLGERGTNLAKPLYTWVVNAASGVVGGGVEGAAKGGIGEMLKGFGGDIMGLFKGEGSFMSKIGGLFNSGGSGGWLSSIASFAASLFHTGGVAGSASMSRAVNPGVFRNASYYHTGGTAGMPSLASNEVPAILTRGERILTLGQQAAMGTQGRTGDNVVFNPNIVVNYTGNGDAATGKNDAADIGKVVQEQIQRQFNQMMLKAQRDGGMLSR